MDRQRYRQMTKVDLIYNPNTKEKQLFIDNESVNLEKCWGNGNKDISKWADTFFITYAINVMKQKLN